MPRTTVLRENTSEYVKTCGMWVLMMDTSPDSHGLASHDCNAPTDRSILERLGQLDDRCNRIILVGQSLWIERLIKALHVCGIGETILWSPAVPISRSTAPSSDQVVRILSRPRLSA